MKTLKTTRYQLYILAYHLYFIGYVINSAIFRQEFFLVLLLLFTLLETKGLIKNPRYSILMGGLAIVSILSFFLRNYYTNASLALYFFMLPVMIFSYTEKRVGYRIHLIPLTIFATYVIFSLINGIDPNNILDSRSRNMVSLYLILFVVYYYIEKYRYTGRLDLWPATLALVISVLTIGRSGILTSLLLLLNVSYFKLGKSSPINKIAYSFIAFILVVLLTGLFQEQLDSLFDISFARFKDRGIEDEARSSIIEAYMESIKTDPIQLLLGSKLESGTFATFKYNLHNSFLSLHYFTGIFSIIILLFIIKALIFTREKLFYRGLLFIVLVRGAADQVFFFNFNDVIIFYLLFLITSKNKGFEYQTTKDLNIKNQIKLYSK